MHGKCHRSPITLSAIPGFEALALFHLRALTGDPQADFRDGRSRRDFPAAIACFTEDLEGLLNVHRVPVRDRFWVRTTNLVERSFAEERRRIKGIPRLLDERSVMKPMFATLIRCADR